MTSGPRAGRRDPFLGGDGPVEVGRFHGKKERAWILADVGRVASHASRVDRQDERSSADVAVDRHAKDPGAGRRFVPGFPVQAKRPGIADERFGLHRARGRTTTRACARRPPVNEGWERRRQEREETSATTAIILPELRRSGASPSKRRIASDGGGATRSPRRRGWPAHRMRNSLSCRRSAQRIGPSAPMIASSSCAIRTAWSSHSALASSPAARSTTTCSESPSRRRGRRRRPGSPTARSAGRRHGRAGRSDASRWCR